MPSLSIRLCGAAVMLALAAAPSSAETLRARYTVTIIGLPIGTAGLNGVIAPTSYRLDLSAKLTGLAGLLSGFRGAATAAGALNGARIVPAVYSTATSNSETSRTVRMSMAGGAVRGVDISPPIDPRADRVPLTEADKRGVIDPISAMLMPVATGSALGPNACSRTLPVFDGYARFDVALSYARQEEVKIKGYSGPVIVCNARYTPIAGHRAGHRATQFMADNKDIEVWLAPVGNSRFVAPYKIAARTLIGMTVIEAEEFSVDGQRKAASLRD